MNELWDEPEYACWTAEDLPVGVEYSVAVMREIDAAAVTGLHRLSRGGLEVGGILYGKRQGDVIRVLAQRPIACEHASGPSFILSAKDEKGLQEQLSRPDYEVKALQPVGWYVSHPKSGVRLSPADVQFFHKHMPHPWQVTLVLHPSITRPTRAGFFVRAADGSVRAETSHLEFEIMRPQKAAPPDPAEAAPRSRPAAARVPAAAAHVPPAAHVSPAADHVPPAPHVPAPAHVPPAAENRVHDPFPAEYLLTQVSAPPEVRLPAFLNDAPRKRSRLFSAWLVAGWITLVAVAALAGAFLYSQSGTLTAAEPLALRVSEQNGQLSIRWDASAQPIRNSERGVLSISDGGSQKEFEIDADYLRSGSFTYVRASGDVSLGLTVFPDGRPPVQEYTRFIGPSLASPSGTSDAVERLEAEKLELQGDVGRLTVRNKELEEALRILRQRLGLPAPPADARR